jgi:hypothetical protein
MTTERPTLETPITEYGLVEVSRPVAAALLGFSLKALNRRIADGQIAAEGRVKKTVAVAEIEAIRGRRVSVHEYMVAAHKPPEAEHGSLP